MYSTRLSGGVDLSKIRALKLEDNIGFVSILASVIDVEVVETETSFLKV